MHFLVFQLQNLEVTKGNLSIFSFLFRFVIFFSKSKFSFVFILSNISEKFFSLIDLVQGFLSKAKSKVISSSVRSFKSYFQKYTSIAEFIQYKLFQK